MGWKAVAARGQQGRRRPPMQPGSLQAEIRRGPSEQGGARRGFRCVGTGSGASGRGGAGCSAWGDASGVRCGRASLPPITVTVSCVTREVDGPSISESDCAAIAPRIIAICEDAQGSEIAGWAATAPQPPAAPGPGDRRGWQGGIGAARFWGTPRPNALQFSEAFGIPGLQRP